LLGFIRVCFNFFQELLKKYVISIFPKPTKPAIPAIAVAMIVILAVVLIWPVLKQSFDIDSIKISEREPQKINLHEPEEMEQKAIYEKYTVLDSIQQDSAKFELINNIKKSMHIRKSGDDENIIFIWSSIKNVDHYYIDLIYREYRKRITPLDGIKDTSFTYPLKKLNTNVKYFWELSGILIKGDTIKVQKEFILDNMIK